MAIEAYLVICDQEEIAGRTRPQPKWNGAAAGAEVSSLRTARVVTVEAESVAEAIRAVRQLYGGWIKTTVMSAAKTAFTEG